MLSKCCIRSFRTAGTVCSLRSSSVFDIYEQNENVIIFKHSMIPWSCHPVTVTSGRKSATG